MSRWGRRLGAAGILALGGFGAIQTAVAPSATKQGVDYALSVQRVPRYVKALDFLGRHLHYRLLAREITAARAPDEDRVLAVFAWTRTHLRLTPAGWPVVDDHILHIVIRGHGKSDQLADVFTTLCTYAGSPAFWRTIVDPAARGDEVVLSFVRVDGAWAVFDVARGLVFRDAEGGLASFEQAAADPALVAAALASSTAGSAERYQQLLASAAPLEVPHPLRAELQMPGPRCWYEVRRALGWVARRGRMESPRACQGFLHHQQFASGELPTRLPLADWERNWLRQFRNSTARLHPRPWPGPPGAMLVEQESGA